MVGCGRTLVPTYRRTKCSRVFQDTIVALEALTEVAILDEKLSLDMNVKVSYKKSGDFKSYHLTKTQPFTRPVEVTSSGAALPILLLDNRDPRRDWVL